MPFSKRVCLIKIFSLVKADISGFTCFQEINWENVVVHYLTCLLTNSVSVQLRWNRKVFVQRLIHYKNNVNSVTGYWKQLFFKCKLDLRIKGVLLPILCIDINIHGDRKSKNCVKFIQKTVFSKWLSVYWSFL